MSWVRFNSDCNQGWPFRESACSAHPAPCPGSDVYVFEAEEGYECCGCRLMPDELDSHVAATEAGMIEHLRAHVAAGHHVAASLLEPSPFVPPPCPKCGRPHVPPTEIEAGGVRFVGGIECATFALWETNATALVVDPCDDEIR